MPNFFGMESTDKSSYSKPPALCTRGSTTEELASAAKAKPDVKMEATLGDTWKKTANRHVPDMFAPLVFDGVHPDPETWLAHFKRYVRRRPTGILSTVLKSAATDWYDGLSAIQKRSRVTVEGVRTIFLSFPNGPSPEYRISLQQKPEVRWENAGLCRGDAEVSVPHTGGGQWLAEMYGTQVYSRR